jgi:hypothetical protein
MVFVKDMRRREEYAAVVEINDRLGREGPSPEGKSFVALLLQR